MRQGSMRKTKLAASLSALLAVSTLAQAQEQQVEVIEVKGMRGSMQKSLATKRGSEGVVDSISAEDIGKFPDTNLAESLQRITGVSIDRVNGEGSKITVRGFGPEFNLVLLNNRVMPTAQVSGESTRSFNFANLSSDTVSAVDVVKTGQANLASGGIGSTVNIQTARPLDGEETVATIGVKGLHDTGVEDNDKLTHEISGLFSKHLLDGKLGLGVSASHMKRNSTIKAATIDGWRQNIHEELNPNAVVINNNQNPYGNTFYARNIGYSITNIERNRTNAQAVAQYQASDDLEFTVDYTYSKLTDNALADTFGLWFSGPGNATYAHINENGTFDMVTEVGGDYSATMHQNGSESENHSLGFNTKYFATDNLSFVFDAHSSKATANGSLGQNADNKFFIAGALNVLDKSYDASSTDIPLLSATFDDSNTPGAVNIHPEDYATLFAGVRAGRNQTEVNQVQLDGQWENDAMNALTSIQFGVGYLDMNTHAQGSYTGPISAGWYGNKGAVADKLTLVELDSDFLGSFSGGGSDMIIPYYHTYDQASMMAWAESEYGVNYQSAPFSDDHKIQEQTASAYVQANFETEIADMPLTITTGLRYEQTDVTANSLQQEALSIVWLNPTEWQTVYADEQTYSNETNSYSEFLPNLDAKLDISDNLVGRFSYSKTMTRPSLGAMRATTSLTALPKVGSRSGFAGNTQLKPYTANNIDLSLEYYYGDASYVSVGWFNKDVENFLVNTIDTLTFDHIQDPYKSDAANQARDEIIAAGGTPSDEAVFNWLIDNGYGNANGQIEHTLGADDAEWLISRPNNVEKLNINGFEMALQHWFGDSGFGSAVNYTAVFGDTQYDVESTTEQFALPGLSDTANAALFYDKDGFQTRIAYNWRDKFLSSMGQAEAGGPAPQFTEAYGQLDFSMSYQINEQISVQAEGINILNASSRIHGRYEEQMLRAQENEARYAIGARFVW